MSTEGNSFYQNLVENASVGVVTIDTKSQVIYSNPAIEDLLGYKPDDLREKSLTKIIPDRFVDDHRRAFETFLCSGDPTIDWNGIELQAEHRDGHVVDVEISFYEHVDDGDRVFTGFISDISERKEREQELRHQNERLDEFASVVSHDLRNPINVAEGRLELAQEEYDSEHLDSIESAINRIDHITEDVLWLAREGRDIGSMNPVLLQGVIDAAWEIVADRKEHADLRYADDGLSTAKIEADKDRLRRLVENLISNALEHGGRDVTVTVGSSENGFYVGDDGPGIPEDRRSDIFVAGYSTAKEGTGFGLSIVKQIAEGHDWEICVTEGSDGGTRFEITGVDFVAE